MDWTSWKKRFGWTVTRTRGTSLLLRSLWTWSQDLWRPRALNPSKRQVQSVGVRELPAGALAPSANKSNVTDDAAVRRTIAEVSERVGNGAAGWACCFPTWRCAWPCCNLKLFPKDRQRGGDPGALANARVPALSPGGGSPELSRWWGSSADSVEILGVAVRGSVLAEYEAAMSGINGGPALVLPATVALLPLLPEEAAGNSCCTCARGR